MFYVPGAARATAIFATRIAGIKVDFPSDMLRRPKKWLNHIAALNPQLGAKAID